MKTKLLSQLIAASVLLSGCTSPFGQTTDQYRIAQGYAMQEQMAAHHSASMAAAGYSRAPRSPRVLQPLQPLAPFAK